MPWTNAGDECGPGVHFSTYEARGGEIILRTRARRAVFLGGLIGAVILGLAMVVPA